MDVPQETPLDSGSHLVDVATAARLADRFAAVSTLEGAASALARSISELTDGTVAYLATYDADDPQFLTIHRTSGVDPEQVETMRIGAQDPFPLARSLQRGRALLVESNQMLDDLRCDDPGLRRVDPSDHACLSIPLECNGAVIGAVNVGYADPGAIPQEQLARIDLVVRIAASAVDRAITLDVLERRARVTEVLEHVADGVIVVDPEGVLRLWNRAMVMLTGIPSTQAIGRLVSEVLDDWERFARYIRIIDDPLHTAISAGEPVPVSIAGNERWLAITGMRIDHDVVYSIRDTTDQHLQSRALLDELATTSHQLRTPVTSIQGAALTLRRTDIELDPAMREQLEDVLLEGTERLGATIDTILDIGRLRSSRRRSAPSVVDLAEVVDRLVTLVIPEEPTFDVSIDLRCPERIRTDARALDTVLSNLLENSVKYSPTGGELTITARLEDRRLELVVADSGIGMSEFEQAHAFDRFFRADPHMRSGVAGTGLGLYISSEVAERAGGQLSVESEPGVGSTFHLSLPAFADDVPEVQSHTQRTTNARRRTMNSEESRERLVAAAKRFDALAVQDEISHMTARYGQGLVSTELLAPVLRTLARSDGDEELAIAHEHFFSAIVQSRLWTACRAWERPGSPRVLLAGAPSESHMIGPLMFGSALNEQGWSITWLGARTPVQSLARAVDRLSPRAVIVSAQYGGSITVDEVAAYEQLAQTLPVFLGGREGSRRAAASQSLLALPDDVVEAALDPRLLELQLTHMRPAQ